MNACTDFDDMFVFCKGFSRGGPDVVYLYDTIEDEIEQYCLICYWKTILLGLLYYFTDGEYEEYNLKGDIFKTQEVRDIF